APAPPCGRPAWPGAELPLRVFRGRRESAHWTTGTAWRRAGAVQRADAGGAGGDAALRAWRGHNGAIAATPGGRCQVGVWLLRIPGLPKWIPAFAGMTAMGRSLEGR